MKVWDAAVRVAHWCLAGGVGAAWLTSETGVRFHEPVGYAVAAVVLMRVLWGFSGGPYARFRQFVRGPVHTWNYTLALWRRAEPRYIGHNPLGGWMAIALLGSVAAVVFTGWLCTTDRYWGDDAMTSLHGVLAWLLAGLIALHIAGVIFTSIRHRENLVRAMFSGIKRDPEDSDVA